MSIMYVKYINIFKEKYDLFLILIGNLLLFLIFFLTLTSLYNIPYRDMFFGFYPFKYYEISLFSLITPEDFGKTTNYSGGYLLTSFLTALDIRTGFTLTLFLPLFLSCIAMYKLLSYLNIISPIRVIFSLFYSYNWVTITLWGHTLWHYAYAMIPLIILYTHKVIIYNDTFLSKRFWFLSLKLSFVFFISTLYWNLPAIPLVAYFTISLAGIAIFKSLFLLKSEIKTKIYTIFVTILKFLFILILTICLTLPFTYPRLLGVLFYGVEAYAISAGHISSSFDWYQRVGPGFFKDIFSQNLFSVVLLPFTSLPEGNLDNLHIISLVLIFLTYVLYLLSFFSRNTTIQKNKKDILLANIIHQFFLSFLILLILFGKREIINLSYSYIPLLSLLITPVNYMLLLTPSIILVYAVGCNYFVNKLFLWLSATEFFINRIKINKLVKSITIILLFFLVITPSFKISFDFFYATNIQNRETYTLGVYNVPIQYFPPEVLSELGKINNKRLSTSYYRIFWVPISSETRDILKSCVGDLHTTNIFLYPSLGYYYSSILFNLASDKGNGDIIRKSLFMLGYKYIGLLKFASGNSKISLEYTRDLNPKGIVGSPDEFSLLFKHLNMRVVYDSKYIRLFDYSSDGYKSKDSSPFLALYEQDITLYHYWDLIHTLPTNLPNKNNKAILKLYTENTTLDYILQTQYKIGPYNVIRSFDNVMLNLSYLSVNDISYIGFSFFLYYTPFQIESGKIIGLNNTFEIMTSHNKYLVFTLTLENGTKIKTQSNFVVRPYSLYHIYAFFNGTHLLTFLNGALDSIKKISSRVVQLKQSKLFYFFKESSKTTKEFNVTLINPIFFINPNRDIKQIIWENMTNSLFPHLSNETIRFQKYSSFDRYVISVKNSKAHSILLALSMKYDNKWIAVARNNYTSVILKPIKLAGWMQGFLVPPGNWVITVKYDTLNVDLLSLIPLSILMAITIIFLKPKNSKKTKRKLYWPIFGGAYVAQTKYSYCNTRDSWW